MIITAFLGYVLPWGQMSFWAAMVITTLLSAIPLIGNDLIFLLWGGFTISDITLYRLYVLHFIFPLIILFLSMIHISFSHEFGSTNKVSISIFIDGIPFSPYYVLKDIFSIIIVLIIIILLISILPDLLNHNLNFEIANFLVTPIHIVPEWYLLFFYALLRSVPSKLGGLFLMICSFICLYGLCYLIKNNIIKGGYFKPWHLFWFWIFFMVCLYLGWIGGLPVMDPYIGLGRTLSAWYFSILVLILPIQGWFDNISYYIYNFDFFSIFLSISYKDVLLFFFYTYLLIKKSYSTYISFEDLEILKETIYF